MSLDNINRYSFEKYLQQGEELVKRHNQSKPPQEAYFYFPTQWELVEYDPKQPQKTLRRIFQNKMDTYLDYEENMLRELETEITNYNIKNPLNKLIFPSWYERFDKLRFLQASSYKIQKTIKLIKENIEWRISLIPPVVTPKVFEILNSGFLYVHGRDYLYRPIIVINFDYYKKYEKSFQYNDWLQAIIFIMEYLITHMLVPGQVENWNIITDLGSVSLLFIPSDAKKILNVLQANYRCRLVVNFIFGMGFVMRGILGMFKSMLDETAQRKLRIISSNNRKEVFEIINEEQVEERFGGKAPNIIPGSNRLFPPIFPSSNYQRDRSKNVVSEKEYKDLYNNNKLSVVNEVLLDKWKREEEENKIREEQNANKQFVNDEKIKNDSKVVNANEKKIENLKTDKTKLSNKIIDDRLINQEIVLNEFSLDNNLPKKNYLINLKKNKNRSFKDHVSKIPSTPEIFSSLNTKKIEINLKPTSSGKNEIDEVNQIYESTSSYYNPDMMKRISLDKELTPSNTQSIGNSLQLDKELDDEQNNRSEINPLKKCQIY